MNVIFLKGVWDTVHLLHFSKFAGNMLVLNSSTNFVVFVLCGRRFRQKVKNLLWCQNNKVGAIDGSTAGPQPQISMVSDS